MSQNDVLTPTILPEPCNNGSGYILTGIENISIGIGTGVFSGLDPQHGAIG